MHGTMSAGNPLAALGRPNVFAIRAEAASLWERRSPLCPRHVAALVSQGMEVIVAPSARRVFSEEEFEAAGARISSDLSEASTVLGIKAPAPKDLLPGRNHLFFSHTIKAQAASMPLLDEVLSSGAALYDYECLAEPTSQRRLVAFGEFAGLAGAVDILHGLGQRLLSGGVSTPFLQVAQTYTYPSLAAALAAVAAAGAQVAEHGFPAAVCPLVVAVTGSGNSARGALRVLRELPHTMVSPEDLPALHESRGDPAHRRQVYVVQVRTEQMVARHGGGPVRKREYYHSPHLYRPSLAERVLPYVQVLIHCIYWDSRFPVLLTGADLLAMRAAGHLRLQAIADVTCDVAGGSIDFSTQATSIDAPFYCYDPATGERRPGAVAGGEGSVVVLAVDNLPSELPRESSEHFGDCLLPFLPPLGACAATRMPGGPDLPPELQAACIARKGELTAPFTYIARLRAAAGGARPDGDSAEGELTCEAVALVGHLFDRGLINRALDIIESRAARFQIAKWRLGQNHSALSAVELLVYANTPEEMINIRNEIAKMAPALDPCAEVAFSPAVPGGGAGAGAEEDRPRVHGWDGGESPVRGGQLYQRFLASTGDEDADADADDDGGSTPPPSGPGETTRVREWTMAALASPKGRRAPPRPPAFSHGPRAHHPHVAAGSAPAPHTPSPVPEAVVLVLGAGFCARPLVRRLAARAGTQVVLASLLLADLERVAAGIPGVQKVVLDPTRDLAALRSLIDGSEVVVSMLPAPLHPSVARECVAAGRHLVTASYVSEEMRSMAAEAEERGVLLLNECGLDPGIDHVTAVSSIRGVQAKGGRVVKFTSMCGGLPAPEAANNPLGYKFSWSPRGVLTAGLQTLLDPLPRSRCYLLEHTSERLLSTITSPKDTPHEHALFCPPACRVSIRKEFSARGLRV